MRLSELEPWAYVTDGFSLYEVLEVGQMVRMVNCKTGQLVSRPAYMTTKRMRLVQEAPVAPDYVEV